MTELLILAQPPDGGVYRHIATVAPRLVARGFTVTVAGPATYANVGGGVRHVELDSGRGIAPGEDLGTARRLRGLVRATKPALIHAHSSKMGALARALHPTMPRTPVVYTAHGYAFAGHFDSERQRRLYRLIETGLSPLTTRVLCVCAFEQSLAESVGSAKRTRVVHNGVAVPGPVTPDPRIARLAAQGPVVGAIALLRPGKGVETLIAATPAILEAAPTANVVIGGGGPLEPELRAQAEAAGVSGRVHFLGGMPDASTALSGVTVAVHPSWAESFPYAVLEAMALGLPTVATDVGGTSEALEDGRSGRLVAPHDPAALAQAVTGLLADADLAARLGAAARARVADRFSLDRMADGAAAVYAELGVRP